MVSVYMVSSSPLCVVASSENNLSTRVIGDRHRWVCSKALSSSTPGIEFQKSNSMGNKDLLVVGPGVLGRLVAQFWMKENSDCKVVGQTISTTHHDELRNLGIVPSLKSSENQEKFPYVVFCAPPSGSQDYASEVRLAAQRWNGEGCLLFTSSSAVYDRSDNGICDETNPTVPKGKSTRVDVLLNAEDEVLKANGSILRLAGLYTLDRGAHSYYLKVGTVDARPDHIVNLIHYEDAASLCVMILKKEYKGRIFMGCDEYPITRGEIMDSVNSSGKFANRFERFTATDGPLGKRMNNSATRSEMNWQPKFRSFPEFLNL